jgi:acetylornithine/N-succinyldiaminopimelate aminotransferase
MSQWTDMEARYFFRTGARMPVTLVRGQGTRVWDDEDKEYLDFFGGPSVLSLGHSHPVVVEALTAQAKEFIYFSNAVYTIPQLKLAQMLVENSALDRVYFTNSGAEANDGALKLARKWGKEKKEGAFEIISTLNGFHGRTIGSISVTGTERYRAPFEPLIPGVNIVPFDDFEAIKAATTDKTCAILLEPVQGEGGVNIPSDDYFRNVRSWCDEQNILLILDEVQTGVGRLGTLWGYQQFGAEPDVMTLAKGIGSGVPLGAFMAKERANVFTPGDHGSTYGGNPLMTAVGYAVVKYVIENDVPAIAKARGEHLMQKLHGLQDRHGFITDVRGRGLLCAIQFDRDIGGEVNLEALKLGLLANNVRPDAIRMSPPLLVSGEEIDDAVDRLDQALKKFDS